MTDLKELVKTIKKEYGEHSIKVGAELGEVKKIRSNIPAINYVSQGGFPVGRIIELVGGFSCLKSYTAYDAIMEFQYTDWSTGTQRAFKTITYDKDKVPVDFRFRKGYKSDNPIIRTVVLVDVEGTYTKDWGAKLGIDNDGLLVVRPASLSEAVNITEMMLGNPSISLVVFDSMSIIGTDDEIDKPMEKDTMGAAPRFWNRAVRKFGAAMNRNPTGESTLILMNSTYSKVGLVMGNPEVIRNGDQLKLSKTLSIRYRSIGEVVGEYLGMKEVPLGRNIEVKTLKNKLGYIGRKATFFYSYVQTDEVDQYSTDVVTQYIDLATRHQMIDKAGSYLKYKSVKAQGAANFAAALKASGELESLIKELEEKVFV